MPLFGEDPAHLSKSRLKSDLVAHNVALPPANSKKEVYVELHLKHIDQRNTADFSSDEEDRGDDVADKEEEKPDDAEGPDPSQLTDDDLKAALLKHGVKAGPIVASTRALYEKKLRKLLQSDGRDEHLNEAEKGVLYSDSEDGEEGSEKAEEETVEQSDNTQQESSQNGFVYPQCFLLPSRLRACASRNKKPFPKKNSENVLKSSASSRSRSSQIPVGISRASSVDQRSGLGSGVPAGSQSAMSNGCSTFSSQAFSITQMVEQMESRMSLSTSTDTERELNGGNEQKDWSRSNRLDMPIVDKHTKKNQSLFYTPAASPSKCGTKVPMEPVDVLKDTFPNTQLTPTGIYATRRRPIKGAAGRPIQYAYPDTPTSPTTLERREVERRLVPIYVQILVFFIVVVLLYLISVLVDDGSFSSLMALLDSMNQETDNEESLLQQAEIHNTPAVSGQE